MKLIKPRWVVRSEYYGTNVLAHQKNEEQAVMTKLRDPRS